MRTSNYFKRILFDLHIDSKTKKTYIAIDNGDWLIPQVVKVWGHTYSCCNLYKKMFLTRSAFRFSKFQNKNQMKVILTYM